MENKTKKNARNKYFLLAVWNLVTVLLEVLLTTGLLLAVGFIFYKSIFDKQVTLLGPMAVNSDDGVQKKKKNYSKKNCPRKMSRDFTLNLSFIFHF